MTAPVSPETTSVTSFWACGRVSPVSLVTQACSVVGSAADWPRALVQTWVRSATEATVLATSWTGFCRADLTGAVGSAGLAAGVGAVAGALGEVAVAAGVGLLAGAGVAAGVFRRVRRSGRA